MTTSPRTSTTAGHPSPCSRSGTVRMVRTFSVIASPVVPSPRVPALTSMPSS
jgi:hypothetical protein